MDRRPSFDPEAALDRHFALELRAERCGAEGASARLEARSRAAAKPGIPLLVFIALVPAGLLAAALGAAARAPREGARERTPSRIEAASLERLGAELVRVAMLVPDNFQPGRRPAADPTAGGAPHAR